MKCPNCKEKLQGKPKFCPYCGATTAEIKAQGLFSDADCPVDEHEDAEVLKPEDFREKSSLEDDIGMTFVERELRNERKNFEFAEYEKRDSSFDYFGADDSRYFDSSRYDFGAAPTIRNADNENVVDDKPQKAYSPTVAVVNPNPNTKPSAQELKKQFNKMQKVEKRPLEQQKKSKSLLFTLIKIFIVFLIIARIASAIDDELSSNDDLFASSSNSYSSLNEDYEDVSEFCDELSSAFENYDLEGILALNYDFIDKQDDLNKYASLYSAKYGSEEKACEALFEELAGNTLEYFEIDSLDQMNITLDTSDVSFDSDDNKDYIFCDVNVDMSSMPSENISFYVIKDNEYIYYSVVKGE